MGTRALGGLVVVLLGLWSTGCSEDEPASDPDPSPAPEPAAEPTSRPVGELEVARVDLTGAPDWLAADDTGVWVKHDDGTLSLVDPGSRRVVDSVDLGGELCAGLGAAYDAIWSCSGADVVKVDPGSLEVTATFELDRQVLQGHLVGAFDRVWVLTGDGSRLVGIDPVTDEVAVEVDLPARCEDVAAGDAGLWLPCRADDRVLQLDPATGEVLRDIEVDNPVGIAVDSDVWVAAATNTVRLDPDSGEVVADVAVGAEPDGAVTLDEASVWVRSGDEFLVRIDRATEEATEQIQADVTSGGDVIVLDGLVWTTAFDEGALFVLDPAP